MQVRASFPRLQPISRSASALLPMEQVAEVSPEDYESLLALARTGGSPTLVITAQTTENFGLDMAALDRLCRSGALGDAWRREHDHLIVSRAALLSLLVWVHDARKAWDDHVLRTNRHAQGALLRRVK